MRKWVKSSSWLVQGQEEPHFSPRHGLGVAFLAAEVTMLLTLQVYLGVCVCVCVFCLRMGYYLCISTKSSAVISLHYPICLPPSSSSNTSMCVLRGKAYFRSSRKQTSLQRQKKSIMLGRIACLEDKGIQVPHPAAPRAVTFTRSPNFPGHVLSCHMRRAWD